MVTKIGFGGSCHWCTEAIFLSLKGVNTVGQGWIAATGDDEAFSEAVIVVFNPKVISLQTLVAVHLYTHSCTANHSMRSKYRSAIYTFDETQAGDARQIIQSLQHDFDAPILTKIIPYRDFRLNQTGYLNYYYNNPDKPFCQNIINPKLRLLMNRFAKDMDESKLKHLDTETEQG